jgi:hypothetical protein
MKQRPACSSNSFSRNCFLPSRRRSNFVSRFFLFINKQNEKIIYRLCGTPRQWHAAVIKWFINLMYKSFKLSTVCCLKRCRVFPLQRNAFPIIRYKFHGAWNNVCWINGLFKYRVTSHQRYDALHFIVNFLTRHEPCAAFPFYMN